MKQVTINAYSFDELDEKAKERAREWMRGCLDVDDVSDGTTNDAKSVGIEITGWDIGREQVCDLSFKDSAYLTAVAIIREHGEGCDTFKAAKEYLKRNVESQALADNGQEQEADDMLEEAEEAFTKALSRAYLKMLTDEHDACTGDEYIDETIIANDYLFTKDGRRTVTL